jgi:hypothetical protein
MTKVHFRAFSSENQLNPKYYAIITSSGICGLIVLFERAYGGLRTKPRKITTHMSISKISAMDTKPIFMNRGRMPVVMI